MQDTPSNEGDIIIMHIYTWISDRLLMAALLANIGMKTKTFVVESNVCI